MGSRGMSGYAVVSGDPYFLLVYGSGEGIRV